LVRGPVEGQSDDRSQWNFGRLLAWNLERGTRPGGKTDHPGRQWGVKAFAEAVGVGDRTIRYWLRNEHLPPEIETTERLLFGTDACYAEWRLELRRAYAARGKGQEDPHVSGAQTGNALPASNIPIRVPEHFLGRDDALAAVETSLKRFEGRVAITAVHGLRGVGLRRKTSRRLQGDLVDQGADRTLYARRYRRARRAARLGRRGR